MSRTMSETDHNNGDRPIAAEYVLGVLDAGERRAVEHRLASDRALAREVEFWEARLGPLADGVIPITPPATTWWRIEGALGPAPESPRSPKSQPKFGPNSGLWQSIAFWRAFAIGSSGFAAACFGALLYIALVPDARVPLIATINSSSGQPNFVATVT